jgi:hypothetical protein
MNQGARLIVAAKITPSKAKNLPKKRGSCTIRASFFAYPSRHSHENV